MRVLALAVLLSSCHHERAPLPTGKTATVQVHGCALHASVTPERAGYDESLELTFRVVPDCDDALTVLSTSAIESKLGRDETFYVSAMSKDGDSAPSRDGGETFGSASGYRPFTRAKPFEAHLVVSKYVVLHPGRWEVKVERRLTFGKKSDPDEDVDIHVSTFIEVSDVR